MTKKSHDHPKIGGMLPGGVVLAVPSWVMPGTLEANCRFLAGKANEVGLLFLEAETCLAYTKKDLPDMLASLPLTWHAHLPLDLSWDGSRAVETCLELMDKVAFLGVQRAVLHPPAAPVARAQALLEAFAFAWAGAGRDTSCILLENTAEHTLLELSGCIAHCGFQVCLDLGHILAYSRENAVEFLSLAPRAGMVHLNAPGPANRGGHSPLTALDAKGRAYAQSLCRAIPRHAVIMLELFVWDDIAASLPLVHEWLDDADLFSTRDKGGAFQNVP